MAVQLIDGKALSDKIKDEIAEAVRGKLAKGLDPPHLAAVLVGDDAASDAYVRSKERACREVGFTSSVYRFPEDFTEEKLVEVIDFLNADDEIDGFIVQLPLPARISMNRILGMINPAKDVDGFHPVNVGRMLQGLPCFLPATPMGIMTMLERYRIETAGKHCVVLGRSNIVGTPVSVLMSRKNYPGDATVTLCHSRTRDLEAVCRSADILICALGQPHFVKEDMVKDGAVVIDVGIHRIPDESRPRGYYTTGDVDFDRVAPKCSYITPVPGGVGLMTIVSLLKNTLMAAAKEIYPSDRA